MNLKKSIILFVLSLITATQFVFPVETQRLEVDFADPGILKATVNTLPRFNTAIVLPKGKRARVIAIGDPDSWIHQSDRRYILLQPRGYGIQTSLTIITDDDCHYFLELSSLKRNPNAPVHSFVTIRDRLPKPEIPKTEGLTNVKIVKHDPPPKPKAEPLPAPSPPSTNRYRIRKKRFGVRQVFDDGTFTYIDISGCRELPGVFVQNGRRKKTRQPVRTSIEGNLLVIHHFLERNERLVLALDRASTAITREG